MQSGDTESWESGGQVRDLPKKSPYETRPPGVTR
jgi:hypothetical protein